MKTESELEWLCKIAEAKLGVAETLRFPIAGFAGLLAYSVWDSWPIALGIAIILVFLVPHQFSKEYDRAWDAYERATGTGKHYRPKEEPNQSPEPTAPSGRGSS
jgi:hypothetical protein